MGRGRKLTYLFHMDGLKSATRHILTQSPEQLKNLYFQHVPQDRRFEFFHSTFKSNPQLTLDLIDILDSKTAGSLIDQMEWDEIGGLFYWWMGDDRRTTLLTEVSPMMKDHFIKIIEAYQEFQLRLDPDIQQRIMTKGTMEKWPSVSAWCWYCNTPICEFYMFSQNCKHRSFHRTTRNLIQPKTKRTNQKNNQEKYNKLTYRC